MKNIDNILKGIEETPESELEIIFRHVMHKVEAFANLMRLDQHARGFLRTLLTNAIMLYSMMADETDGLRESESVERYVKAVQRVKSANVSKVEETLFLARDISQEYLLATSIKIT